MASIGLVELSRYDAETLPKRKLIYDAYTKALSKYSWAITPEYETADKTSSYHVYALRIKDASEEQRDAIIAKIFERQVSVNVHFIPVPQMSFYVAQGYNINNYPQTIKQYQNEISLPVWVDLTSEQIETVIHSVVSSVGEVIG
jgi:dTDP-4-amino-4,6-dideoxygalactose transaminase